MLFLCPVSCFLVGPIVFTIDTYVNEDFSFSSDEKFTLTVSACRILFKKGTDNDVTVHVNSRTQALFGIAEA